MTKFPVRGSHPWEPDPPRQPTRANDWMCIEDPTGEFLNGKFQLIDIRTSAEARVWADGTKFVNLETGEHKAYQNGAIYDLPKPKKWVLYHNGKIIYQGTFSGPPHCPNSVLARVCPEIANDSKALEALFANQSIEQANHRLEWVEHES